MQGKRTEVINTSGKYKIKTDTVLKNFWRDNARFADLFNAVLFNGDNVIKPEALEEADTDLSSILKNGSHAETLQKILDVVKKSAYSVEIVNDYKMNLIQVRESEQLRFQNPDVQTVFDVSRNIFKKNYGKIEDIYREQEIDSELLVE